MQVRVLLADDHRMFREALRGMLERDADIRVVGEVGDGLEVVRQAGESSPEVVCMDVGMPGLNGIEATRRIMASHPEMKVIGLSAFSDQRFVLEMLSAGAVGYVTKAEAGEELVRAIHAVHRHQTYLCPEVGAMVADALRRGKQEPVSPKNTLGPREKEILSLLAEGCSSPTMADRLKLAPATVEVHRRNIMRKLNLHSVAELTKYAIRNGLTSA